MNNYFILHGTGGSPEENWFPWLKNEIEKQGKKCTVPQFPVGDKQSYESWSNELDKYLDKGEINENTIFITHSISPIFIIKYILDHKIQVFGLVSVSGFNNYYFKGKLKDYNKLTDSFFVSDDTGKVNKYCRFVYCIYSDDDPYIKRRALEAFAIELSAEKCVINSGGHFNRDSGYLRFDKMLEIIKQIDNGMDFAENDDMPVSLNFIITNDNDDILLGRRINRYGHGTYALPGGKLKCNETFEDCTKRELKEEVGITVADEDIKIINIMTTITTKHIVQIGVLIKKYSGTPTNMEPHKCDELGFFPKNNLPQPLFIGNKANIDLYLQGKMYDKNQNLMINT